MKVPTKFLFLQSTGSQIDPICSCSSPIVFLVFLIFQIELTKLIALCSNEPTKRLSLMDNGDSSYQHERRYTSKAARSVYFAALESSTRQIDDNNSRKYASDFGLNNQGANIQEQPAILDQCCACDESKYELVFEGLWSRYTHPDNFPENYWLAYFSDIIGASHSNEFKMWSPGSMASDGVKELAETGMTKKLESELKTVSSKTRTIIKARELRYPTLNSKTSAVFRTDRQHHLVSILSKLGPSPDWMVGVSALELCQSDCTWTPQRVVNLHLWDAGTDSGVSFTSADLPTRPQDRIHLVLPLEVQKNSNSSETPNQSGSSVTIYYNNHSQRELDLTNPTQSASSLQQLESMKPFARLTITRQRIYEKSCNSDPMVTKQSIDRIGNIRINNTANYPLETNRPAYTDCRFTEWSDWSSCSSTCGKGLRTRTRAFLNDHAHLMGCSQVDLIEKEVCLSECIGNTTCVTRDWSDWSKCSINCGPGIRKRLRYPIGQTKPACESIELVEIESCMGSCAQDEPPRCELTEWSQWSECSVACGKGTRIRTRQFVRKEDVEKCNVNLIQKQACKGRLVDCNTSPTKVPSSDRRSITSNPNLPVIDCKLSDWSPWSTCSALCGNGKRSRSRYVIQMPQNGGRPCDKKLTRTQRCKDLPRCPPGYENFDSPGNRHNNTKERFNKGELSRTISSTTTYSSSIMDDEDDSENVTEKNPICTYGNWTQWSECEVVCRPVQKGSNKVRQRHPTNEAGFNPKCQVLEELYYCDPKIYC